MKNRWQFDEHHAARPPPNKDFAEEALDTVVAWGLLLFFAIVLGLIVKLFGLNDD